MALLLQNLRDTAHAAPTHADEMDALLGLERTGLRSVQCRKGQYKVV